MRYRADEAPRPCRRTRRQPYELLVGSAARQPEKCPGKHSPGTARAPSRENRAGQVRAFALGKSMFVPRADTTATRDQHRMDPRRNVFEDRRQVQGFFVRLAWGL